MLVLNKKRIIFFISVIMISFVSMSLNRNNVESIQTSSTPVSSHTIILDAGHGEPDGGAESSNRR